MPVTKKLKPVAPYQQWTPSGLSNPTGFSNGDILGVYESLGNRCAKSVLVEAIGGDAFIRFNVCQEIHGVYGEMHESWVGLGMGSNRRAPLLLDTVELDRPTIQITVGTSISWTIDDMAINDIKIVSMPSGLRITCT